MNSKLEQKAKAETRLLIISCKYTTNIWNLRLFYFIHY